MSRQPSRSDKSQAVILGESLKSLNGDEMTSKPTGISRLPAGVSEMPQTLTEAHDLLMSLQPKHDASLDTWRKYRELGSRIYAEVADIDRHHYHEAMAWATIERQHAQNLHEETRKAAR